MGNLMSLINGVEPLNVFAGSVIMLIVFFGGIAWCNKSNKS
jgi:hypothetical protein